MSKTFFLLPLVICPRLLINVYPAWLDFVSISVCLCWFESGCVGPSAGHFVGFIGGAAVFVGSYGDTKLQTQGKVFLASYEYIEGRDYFPLILVDISETLLSMAR